MTLAPAPRTDAVRVMMLLYAVNGMLCFLGATCPMADATPVPLLVALGVAGLTGASLIWVVGRRAPVETANVALGVLSVLVGLLASRSVTPAGVVGLGPALICIGLYAAHFMSAPAARLHTGAAITVTTAGALASPADQVLTPWVVNVLAAALVTELQVRLIHRLRESARTDSLTGLSNRRSWRDAATHALAAARRRNAPLTVAILDLDEFKTVNDRHGHRAGDELLRDLAHSWTETLRASDLLGRYGGDEFVLLLPDTDRDQAQDVLARMAAAHPGRWSAGTAMCEPDDSLDDLLERADAALYAEKRGRCPVVD